MSRKLRRLKGHLAVPAIRACMHLVSRLRLRTAGRLGEALGRAAFHTMPGVRARTEANLEIAFPERSPLERRRIAVGTFRLLGTCALEWIVHAGAGIEEEIRAAPEHWAWIHRRWATTPERLRRRRARRARLQAAKTRARLAADRQSS